ncbi:unnamed protein product [Clavelina lepadiformis]|uniref:Uncharacterized protein n=1 Tax=Clavelina lepadiformis TaxID=159417 RepID=A0ABP0GHH4_CLALP
MRIDLEITKHRSVPLCLQPQQLISVSRSSNQARQTIHGQTSWYDSSASQNKLQPAVAVMIIKVALVVLVLIACDPASAQYEEELPLDDAVLIVDDDEDETVSCFGFNKFQSGILTIQR